MVRRINFLQRKKYIDFLFAITTTFAFKHKPQTFSRVYLRFETARLSIQTVRLPLETSVLYKCKRGCFFGRNCHVLTWEITHFSDSKYHVVSFIFTDYNVDRVVKAVARAVIGGGGDVYSYIRVTPEEFLLKSVVFKLISKEISRAEHEYMNIPPPPPQLTL